MFSAPRQLSKPTPLPISLISVRLPSWDFKVVFVLFPWLSLRQVMPNSVCAASWRFSVWAVGTD